MYLFILAPILFLALVGGGAYSFYVYKFRHKTIKGNQILVITGPNLKDEGDVYKDENGRSIKIKRGGGVRLRMFQTASRISVNSMQISLNVPRVVVQNGIEIQASAVAQVIISPKNHETVKYIEQFMGKKQEDIEHEITKVLNASFRAILAKLTVEQINNDRENFNKQVREIAKTELEMMGLNIASFGLENVDDYDKSNGYISNLGRAKKAEIIEIAEKSESDAEKNTRIHKATNNKIAKEEEISQQMIIEEKEKEKNIKTAQIKAEVDRERMIADKAEELEAARLAIELKEKEKAVELKEEQELARIAAERQKREIILAETASKKKLIEVQAKAEQDAIQKEKEYELKLRESEVSAQSLIQEANAKSEYITKTGKAEAEAKELMANALAQMSDTEIRKNVVDMLPLLAKNIASSLDNVDSIKIIDSGNGNGLNTTNDYVLNNMAKMQEVVKETIGLDLKDYLITEAAKGRNLKNENIYEVEQNSN